MLAIVDSTCVLPTGHNIDANRIFSDMFVANGVENDVVVCKALKIDGGVFPKNFRKELDHLYGLDGSAVAGKDLIPLSDKNIWALLDSEKYSSYFFINADLLTLQSVASYLRAHPESRKNLCVRLIGVLENHLPGEPADIEKPLGLLQEYKAEFGRSNILLTTETWKYAKCIEERINSKVHAVPYPARVNKKSNKTADKLIFSLLGAPRTDKGYFKVLDIIKGLNGRDVNFEYEFRIQQMSDRSSEYKKEYDEELVNCKNVALLPERLNIEELEKEIKKSNLSLLPYCTKTYYLRGSAILYDSLAQHTPVITYRGTAFADEVDIYKLGRTVDDDNVDQFVDGIVGFAKGQWTADSLEFVGFQEKSHQLLSSFLK